MAAPQPTSDACPASPPAPLDSRSATELIDKCCWFRKPEKLVTTKVAVVEREGYTFHIEVRQYEDGACIAAVDLASGRRGVFDISEVSIASPVRAIAVAGYYPGSTSLVVRITDSSGRRVQRTLGLDKPGPAGE